MVMADPTPTNMKINVTMNSTTRAWMQSGFVTSWIEPMAILAIVEIWNKLPFYKVMEELVQFIG